MLLATWTSKVSQSVQGKKIIKTVHRYISVLYVVTIMHIMLLLYKSEKKILCYHKQIQNDCFREN